MDRIPSLHEDKALGTYLREIAKVSLLTPEEEKTLARKVRSGEENALNQLI